MGNETKKRLLLSKWRGEQDAGRENERECDCYVEDLVAVLTEVKYWMHDAQFRPTWPLLRKVEDALS